MCSGVGLYLIGEGYEHLSEAGRTEIVNHFPRTDFKKMITPAFFEGFKHKTETTFGNIKADVCVHMVPGYQSKIFLAASLILPEVNNCS